MLNRIVERSRAYTEDPQAPKRHHLVPRSYLDRWATEGIVRGTAVDTGRWRDYGLKGVAYEDHFYRLEADDIDPNVTPPLFGEVLFGELEDVAKSNIDTLVENGPGLLDDSKLINQMAFYIAAQHVRGRAFRDEQLTIIEWSAQQDQVELSKALARGYLTIHSGGLVPTEPAVEQAAAAIRANTPISADPKAQALQLMLQQWLNIVPILAEWKWAVYATESALLTSDEPVVLIGASGVDRREKPGFATSAAIVFPLGPDRLLALFPPSSGEPRYPFVLNEIETRQVNAELMATAETRVFERPGSDIAETIPMLPRGSGEQIHDPGGKPAQRYRKPTRWADADTPRPISRWYAPAYSDLTCTVVDCRYVADHPLLVPEIATYASENRHAYSSDPWTVVCQHHHALLTAEITMKVHGYSVSFRNPVTGRKETQIKYPA